ncbi:MAG: hypothetical protein AAB463_01405 [Patescibacteria group bacterium]
MVILTIIPLTRIPIQAPETLSYFSLTPVPRGSLVKVPLARRTINGIVLEVHSLSEARQRIRSGSFAPKKIISAYDPALIVSDGALAVATWIAQTACISLATACTLLFPDLSRARPRTSLLLRLPEAKPKQRPEEEIIASMSEERAVVQKLCASLRKGTQACIIVPDSEWIPVYAEVLAAHNPVVISKNLGAKALTAAREAIADGNARVIIGTRSALLAPFMDCARIIVIDPRHIGHWSEGSPRLHAATFAQWLATQWGATYTTITTFPLVQAKSSDTKNFLERSHTLHVVDMGAERAAGHANLYARSIEDVFRVDPHGHTLVYATRKGFASLYTCRLCGAYAACTNCNIPMRITRATEPPQLMCYRCTQSRPAPDRCPRCHKVSLYATGTTGIEKIASLSAFLAPDVPIFMLDDSTAHPESVLAHLREHPDAILVATAKLFRWKHSVAFRRIIVPSFDTLTYRPDFANDESSAATIALLRAWEPESVHVQTYAPHHPALTAQYDVPQWLESEFQARQVTGYPPAWHLIALTIRGASPAHVHTHAKTCAQLLMQAIQHHKLQERVTVRTPVPALIFRDRAQTVGVILIRTKEVHDFAHIAPHVPQPWRIIANPPSLDEALL